MRRSPWLGLLCPIFTAPAAAADEAPICTDRPTKANVVCTVPAGKLQVETSAIGWSVIKADGARIELLTLGGSFLKFGLSERSDLQLGITPYARLDVKAAGLHNKASGVGDVVVRYKNRLTKDGEKLQVAVIPFMKLPAAKRPLGNRKLEGGIALPISFTLAGPVTMTLGPEVDVLANLDGDGHHAALANVFNLSAPIAPRLTLAGELWVNLNFDRTRTIRQSSADVALAYAVSNDLQLDAGANFGLRRDTSDLEAYAGLSVRF